jgi:hypothetical protein
MYEGYILPNYLKFEGDFLSWKEVQLLETNYKINHGFEEARN